MLRVLICLHCLVSFLPPLVCVIRVGRGGAGLRLTDRSRRPHPRQCHAQPPWSARAACTCIARVSLSLCCLCVCPLVPLPLPCLCPSSSFCFVFFFSLALSFLFVCAALFHPPRVASARPRPPANHSRTDDRRAPQHTTRSDDCDRHIGLSQPGQAHATTNPRAARHHCSRPAPSRDQSNPRPED